jgi:hypothetical protein
MSVAVSILAFGSEHVNEFNTLSKQIRNNQIYVYTDSDEIELNDNIIKIYNKEDFNFNLKRIPIYNAFLDNDVVVMMDTDISLNHDFDFTYLNNIEDGLYVSWCGTVQNYKEKKISINQLLNAKTGIEEVDVYGESLVKCGANINNIMFFDEFIFVIKLSDKEKKDSFIKTWERINYETINHQPKDRHNQILKGALESLIISLSCNLNGIKIFNNKNVVTRLFETITHFGSTTYTKILI